MHILFIINVYCHVYFAMFDRIVNHLHKQKALRMKPGGTVTVPGFDPAIKFTGQIDQFYPLMDRSGGQKVRRSVGIDGKTSELLQKLPHDTIDAVVKPFRDKIRYSLIHPDIIAQGIDVRFSTKHEKPVTIDQVSNTASTAMMSVRIKERVSFITEKSDFSIDCTRVRVGLNDEDAKNQIPTYEVLLFFFCLNNAQIHTNEYWIN